ncbi:uncharacterized protein [Nicotiana tomentosiformis]|uniref:uncharacterized protein n=1 Tax=Nicotiana tomentosiformis TaxID=4098 RepID=UPI00388CC28B
MSLSWQSRANIPQGYPNMIHLHKELQDHGQAISELTTTMTQLAKAQYNQVQGPKKVHVMEGVNVLVNKKMTNSPQMQTRVENYVPDDGGFDHDNSYHEQEEEFQYVNNFQGQKNNFQVSNQQQWRPQNNQGNWSSNNQENWSGNNQGNWGGNNQGGWGNNQGNRGSDFQRPQMYQQPSNPPPYPSHGSNSSNNKMDRIENMFK